MPDPQWYTMQVGGKWYKTQADSIEHAKAKMNAASTPMPEPSFEQKVGAHIPDWTTGPLALGQKYLVDPFEKMAAKSAQIGGDALQGAVRVGIPGVMSGVGMGHDVTEGVARGVGETLGGMVGDPRNWPFLGAEAARPVLQKLMTRGFQAMMAKGTWDAAKDLYNNWHTMTPEQRAEQGTRAGLSAGMTAMLFRGGQPADENPVVAPGKTEADAKATTAAPKTQIPKPAPRSELSYEELKARIAQVEGKIAKSKEPARVEPKPQPSSEVPKPVPPPVQTGAEKLPAEKQAPEAIKEPIAPPESQAPEVRAAKARMRIMADTQYVAPKVDEGKTIDLRPQNEKDFPGATREQLAELEALRAKSQLTGGKIPPSSAPLEVKQDAMRVRQTEEQAKLEELKKLSPYDKGVRPPTSPEVGGQPAPASRPSQPPESVQAPKPPEGPREPVRPAEGPEVTKTGQEPPIRLKDTSPLARLKLAKEMVEAEMAKPENKGVPKSEIQRRVAEKIKSQLGAFGGGSFEEPSLRRERKINEWVKQIRDASSPEAVYTQAYQMLKAYGLSDNDILQRVSGAEGFAEVPATPRQEPGGLIADLSTKVDKVLQKHEQSKAPLGTLEAAWQKFRALSEKDSHGGYDTASEALADIKRQFKGEYGNEYSPETMAAARDYLFLKEGPGEGPDIKGVKGSDIEALEKMGSLPDTRPEPIEEFLKKPFGELDEAEKTRLRKEIESQRGSLSFRRLSPEDRAAANPVTRLADALDKVADFFSGRGDKTPDELARAQQAKNIIREEGSQLARTHLEVMAALEDAIKRHDSPTNERANFIQFMDAGEGKPGATFLNPQDQSLANELHQMFEERWEKIKDIKGLEGDGIENYLAHIWEKSNVAQAKLRGILTGKRPLEGSGRFLKNRFYQYASEGIDHGLSPVTWNPIRLQLAALFDVDRFISAHEIKDRFKDAGLVRWVKLSEYKSAFPDWQRLNDKIFAPKAMGEGALKEYGQYMAPPEVAKIFNNYLSPGLAQNPVFRNFRNYNNALNLWQLGVSGYHGTFISLVSATSDLALGMQKIFNVGDIKGGIKDALRGTLGTFILRSATADYKLGRAIQDEAIAPTGNPRLQAYVDLLMKGGGRFQQDAWYTKGLSDRKGFVNWLRLGKEGKFYEMLTRPIRLVGSPIMEKFVPRVKLGIAAKMMESKLDFMINKQGISDPNSIATELGKIWDSVDNRAGQMVYDNLFWNKAAKDLSFLAVRAVGWDLGSIREYGGGVTVDTPRQLARLLRGKRPELTARMAFTIATPITIGIFGGMMHYMMTGKAPEKAEDYFFPGPEGNKVSFPSYMKDYFAFKQHPLQTAVNKLSPTFSQFVDLYRNADFYGTEIYHPGDPLLKRGWGVLKWYASNWEGFSFKGIQKRIERGESIGGASATGVFGFQPASPYVSMSKAETLASDLSSREWRIGPHTPEEGARHALVARFRNQAGAGHLDTNEVISAWRNKQITDTDVDNIFGDTGESHLIREFKGLSLPDSLAVMREATPNERVQLKPYLMDKADTLDRYPEDAQSEYAKQIRQYLQ